MRFGPLDGGDNVMLNLSISQSRMQKTVQQLSSGLRINSAADDPSGLAIAESLHSVSQGLQTGQTQVQEANSALVVADGAMQSVVKILQRMRNLVVEANSDVNSTQDKADLQAEIDQLKKEIDRIAQNTNFNGKKLLDGSLSNDPIVPPQALQVSNPNLFGGGQFIQMTPTATMDGLQISPFAEISEFSFSIDSYNASTNQLNVTFTAQSQDPSFGPQQVSQFTVDAGTNFPSGMWAPSPGLPTYVLTDAAGNPLLSFNTNNFNPQDVGQTAVIATVSQQTPSLPTGRPLQVNVGQAEGDTVSVSLDSVSTQTLGIGFLQVGNLLTNQASEARLDYAIDYMTTQEARSGSQEVALNAAAENNSIQYVNQVASESNIRDANVAQQVGDLTKEQILTQVGTSVLSQMETSSALLTNLLIGALGAQSINAASASSSSSH